MLLIQRPLIRSVYKKLKGILDCKGLSTLLHNLVKPDIGFNLKAKS